MREGPSVELTRLLDCLGLVHPEQLRRAYGRARRLARGLPLLDSVWVDALVAMRLITPFQASEINAGRGEMLGVGPYVLVEPAIDLGYVKAYAGRSIESRQPRWIAVASCPDENSRDWKHALETLRQRFAAIEADGILTLETTGESAGRVFVGGETCDGMPAADWLIRHGRFPPEAVLEIARQMAEILAKLETHDLLHGDLGVATLHITPAGQVRLPLAGLRAIFRPEEGFARADLPPECYDYLAPERVTDGTPPTIPSDVYACGCLWWHLLSGRPPLAGGNSLAKLKAVHQAKIIDICRLAPDTPGPLAAAIRACIQPNPGRRPESFAQIAQALGPPTGQGQHALAQCLSRRMKRQSRLLAVAKGVRHSSNAPVWVASIAGCILMLLATSWPWWRNRLPLPLAEITSGSGATATNERSSNRSSTMPVGNLGNDPSDDPRPDTPLSQTATVASSLGDSRNSSKGRKEIVLPVDPMVELAELPLERDATVRPPTGRRVQLVIPAEGFAIEVENVRFENIDFIASHTKSNANGKPSVLIELRADAAEFHDCSFQSSSTGSSTATAIAWQQARESVAADELPRSGRLTIGNCVFRGLQAGIDCRARGPKLIKLDNVLCVNSSEGEDSGTLCKIALWPRADEAIVLRLNRCTLRGSPSLIDIASDETPSVPGKLSIEALDCVFAPRSTGALLRFAGGEHPGHLLGVIDWKGQGSLLRSAGRFGLWQPPGGSAEPLDDSQANIDGLVRGDFEFVGDQDAVVADSEIARWTAPLRSDKPPGIFPAALHLPRLAPTAEISKVTDEPNPPQE